MWLLNAATRELEFFGVGTDTLVYAIVSHTWGDDELSFQELKSASGTHKAGFRKLMDACAEATRRGLKYVWLDTCCIDKTSSSELTESINSMFRWYAGAKECYVLLSDLEPGASIVEQLPKCRWFTRGWTLQELLAPNVVRFYNQDWQYIGDKEEFVEDILHITGIGADVQNHARPLATISAASKMYYASKRTTTRPEDMAYCLLGLFDVYMPLIYGEGPRAFRRLQEEIIKRTNDMTIFAWELDSSDPDASTNELPGLFAPNPAAFQCRPETSCLYPFVPRTQVPDFALTNKGLRIETPLAFMPDAGVADGGVSAFTVPGSYFWELGCRAANWDDKKNEIQWINIGVRLKKVAPGIFVREGLRLLVRKKGLQPRLPAVPSLPFIIHTEPRTSITWPGEPGTSASGHSHYGAIHLPRVNGFELQQVIGESHWDLATRSFLRPFDDAWRVYAGRYVCTAPPLQNVEVVVFIRGREGPLECRILSVEKMEPELPSFLFQEGPRHNRSSASSGGLCWEDLLFYVPGIESSTNKLRITIEDDTYHVSVSAKKEQWEEGIPIHTVNLRCKLSVREEKSGTASPADRPPLSIQQSPSTSSQLFGFGDWEAGRSVS